MSNFAETCGKFNGRTIQVLVGDQWGPLTHAQKVATLLTIKRSKRLERIDVANQPLDVVGSFVSTALENKRIKHVVLKNCTLPGEIFERVAKSKTLETLEIQVCLVLEYYVMGVNPIKSIGANTSITNLSLVGLEFLSSKYVDEFEDMLIQKDGQLVNLEIGRMKLDDDEYITRRFLTCLKKTRTLKKLVVHIMDYHDRDFAALIDLMKTNRSITELVVKVYQRHWSFFNIDFIQIWAHNISLTTIKHLDSRSTATADNKTVYLEKTRGLSVHRMANRWWVGEHLITKFEKDKLPDTCRYMRDTDLLRRVDQSIFKEVDLVSLVLVNCKIRSRTPFPHLPNLEHLDLSDNSLLDGIDIAKFPSLKWLKLSRCDISSFRHILQPSKLAVLFLDYNPIEKWPIILNSPNLEEVYCAGCPFATPLSDIDYNQEQGRTALLTIKNMYLFRVLAVVSRELGIGFDIPAVLHQFNKNNTVIF